ncbi:DUF1987 domain-containing protein [Brevibacillus sp. NRS-1366]|uniref:DUF1987 domain-containing protein n=1 Tax=Brevibacillus sp. NRS-1366 TaxID=3233899 RepID=UPI003D233CAF
MDKLMIEGTKSTPEVNFDPDQNTLVIKGQSYPENPFAFYEPIMEWVKEYLSQLEKEASVVVELNIPYINTSSSKCFMVLLDLFDEAYINRNKRIKLTWYYDAGNESGLECAEEFKEDLNFPFDIVEKAIPE